MAVRHTLSKWISMTKAELRDELKRTNQFDVNGNGPLWKEAFNLYYMEKKQRLSMSCGGCWPKIRAWLQS